MVPVVGLCRVSPGRAVGQNSAVLVASTAVAVPVAVASAIVAEEAAVHVAILGVVTIVMGPYESGSSAGTVVSCTSSPAVSLPSPCCTLP